MIGFLGRNSISGWLFADTGGPVVDYTFEPAWPMPLWLVVLLFVASAAGIVWIYHSAAIPLRWRIGLTLIRISLVGLLLFMACGWTIRRHRVDLPDLIIAVDDSASMAFEDAYDRGADRRTARSLVSRLGRADLSRWNLVQALLSPDGAGWIGELETRYRLKIYRLGGDARLVAREAEPGGPSWGSAAAPASRLGEGLRQILDAQRGRPTAAIVVLTDGIATGGMRLQEAADLARREAVPLYVVGLGDRRPPRDLRLVNVVVDDTVFVGDVLSVDVSVEHDGYAGREVAVRLLDESGTVVDERSITLDQVQAAQPVQLTHRPPAPGKREYRIELPALAGDQFAENNSVARSVLVRDEQIRVLLAQSYPSYEFRQLKELFSRTTREGTGEAVVQLTTVLQTADFQLAEQDQTAVRLFPVSRDELFRYDVLIFGDVDPRLISSSTLAAIEEFVTVHGGGLVLLAGPRFNPLEYQGTPLADLYPFRLESVALPSAEVILEQPVGVTPTRFGRASPHLLLGESFADSEAVWRSLPGLYWFAEAREVKPAARVLLRQFFEGVADGDPLPVVTLQLIGAGKVVFHATDETYRWARYLGSERYYSRYWFQLIRYLSRSKLLSDRRAAELSADRERYRQGDVARIGLEFHRGGPPVGNQPPRVLLESDQGDQRELQLTSDPVDPAKHHTFLNDLLPGRYRVSLVWPRLDPPPLPDTFDVRAFDSERSRLEMQWETLRDVAAISRGQLYGLPEANDLLEDLPPGRRVRIETLPPQPIWNSPWLALAFVGLLASEWLLRRRLGMV